MTSSAIGQFIIGISPIESGYGNSEGFDWTRTVISQYANSPILLALIEYANENIDQTANITDFYDNVWNIQTATGYGLDVWGRIVGVDRVLHVSGSKYFGFDEAGVGVAPFNNAQFYSGATVTSNYYLADASFRTLIMAKAAANLWGGSIADLNKILRMLFPGQICYCTDGENMTMTYTFEFLLTPVQMAIVNGSGVLPRPCGVSVSVVQI